MYDRTQLFNCFNALCQSHYIVVMAKADYLSDKMLLLRLCIYFAEKCTVYLYIVRHIPEQVVYVGIACSVIVDRYFKVQLCEKVLLIFKLLIIQLSLFCKLHHHHIRLGFQILFNTFELIAVYRHSGNAVDKHLCIADNIPAFADYLKHIKERSCFNVAESALHIGVFYHIQRRYVLWCIGPHKRLIGIYACITDLDDRLEVVGQKVLVQYLSNQVIILLFFLAETFISRTACKFVASHLIQPVLQTVAYHSASQRLKAPGYR